VALLSVKGVVVFLSLSRILFIDGWLSHALNCCIYGAGRLGASERAVCILMWCDAISPFYKRCVLRCM
jgi:hypothetical protein